LGGTQSAGNICAAGPARWTQRKKDYREENKCCRALVYGDEEMTMNKDQSAYMWGDHCWKGVYRPISITANIKV